MPRKKKEHNQAVSQANSTAKLHPLNEYVCPQSTYRNVFAEYRKWMTPEGSLPSFRPAHGTDNRELRLSIDLRRIPRTMLETPASHQEEPDAWIVRVSQPGLHYQHVE